MYRLSLEKVLPGMTVGRSIYNANGNLLLRKNIRLTNILIRQLKALQIPSIYIGSEFPDVELHDPPPLIKERTRIHAIKVIQDVFYKCRLANSTRIDIDGMKSTVKLVIESILTSQNALVQAADIRRHDDYTFAHSINVCVLSTMIGALLNYNEKRLYELSLGALLHDIGKTQIPLSILNKPDRLSKEEFEIIQAHAQIGFEMLRHTKSFSVVPLHAAFQHHERYDGSGYPRHLTGTKIHEYARIVAIADVYDALTADRAYKRACTPDIAFHIMTEESPGHFDPEILHLFFEHVAIYPVGTIVKLQAGYYAVVVDVHKGYAATPHVRLISDADKNLIHHPAIINLQISDPKYHIRSVVKEDELVDLFLNAKSSHFRI